MENWQEAEVIESCYTILLREIAATEGGGLRIVLEEAEPRASSEASELGGAFLGGLRPIEASASSRRFELQWPSYAAYSVRHQPVPKADSSELALSGRLLRRYARSRFLDYVMRSTTRPAESPGPLQHLGIFALDSVIDVVAAQLPTIRTIER